MAVPEFARLSTGAPITRGNSGNGVLLIHENRAARQQKSRNGKGVRRRGERFFKLAFVPHTQGRCTSQLYGLFTTTCGAGLLTSSCALTFWIWGSSLKINSSDTAPAVNDYAPRQRTDETSVHAYQFVRKPSHASAARYAGGSSHLFPSRLTHDWANQFTELRICFSQ